MNRNLYHGSTRIVRSPKFGTGRQYNDFGLGFYCAEQSRYAAEWAAGYGRNGFVSCYSFDPEGLRIINLCGPNYRPLHWLSLLFSFRVFDMSSDTAYRAAEYISRNFPVDYQGCDCIIGYRADNRCFMFAQEFLDGRLPYQSLRDILTSDESNRQFVLKSNRAFDRITFTGYEPALSEDCCPPGRSRELQYIKRAVAPAKTAGLYARDLIEQEVSPYDARL